MYGSINQRSTRKKKSNQLERRAVFCVPARAADLEGGFSPELNPVALRPLPTVASQCVRGGWVLCRANPWREGPVLSLTALTCLIPRETTSHTKHNTTRYCLDTQISRNDSECKIVGT